jgi:hypothetical protein
MLLYQRLTFLGINGLVLAWLLKVLVMDPSSDVGGLFAVGVVVGLLLYAFYFALVVRYCQPSDPETRGDKVKFFLFAVMPFLALWGCTV